jgi:cytochrome c
MHKLWVGLFLISNLAAIPLVGANEALMDKAGCVACHRIDIKYNGPAFKAVAARYRNDPDAAAQLFVKVREGGDGVWGDLPMVPNGPNKISDADLQTLIAWILSL